MPGLAEVGDSHGERKALLQRSVLNVRVSQLYRADFEARNLRKVRKLVNRVCNEAKTAPVELLASLVSAFDKLCERERVLLRIPLPQAAKAPEPRRVSGQTLNYTELPVEQPATMHDATSQDATTSSSPVTSPS
jgi:hypothetical protein